MSMIDSSVINVVLPAMARSLHASIAGVQWVASAYLLALGLGGRPRLTSPNAGELSGYTP
ncbi:MAG: hypothetical protein ACP5QO_08760 [Clostridia bacterium]